MNLTVDIGNSRVKVAVFDDEAPVGLWAFDDFGESELRRILAECPAVRRAIVSSTRGDAGECTALLRRNIPAVLEFDADTPTPLINRYSTPRTLGRDRLAAGVGAAAAFPGRNILIVDFGSAITADMVSAAGEFLGGTISPGASMRLRALHEFTGTLPLLSLPGEGDPKDGGTEECGSEKCDTEEWRPAMPPDSTADAIVAGVVCGIKSEVAGYMRTYGATYENLITIFTGGDALYFVKQFKNTIFVDCDLTLKGLNTILGYNEI